MEESYKDLLAKFAVGRHGRITRESIIEALKAIDDLPSFPDFQFPQPPVYEPSLSLADYVSAVQTYIASFSYSHLRVNFFSTTKYTHLDSIFQTAISIIQACLPIQCLEATFVALYLSFGIENMAAFPLGFKSQSGKTTHKFLPSFSAHTPFLHIQTYCYSY